MQFAEQPTFCKSLAVGGARQVPLVKLKPLAQPMQLPLKAVQLVQFLEQLTQVLFPRLKVPAVQFNKAAQEKLPVVVF